MFFFDTGIQKQLNSVTETECNRNFYISCSICCKRGYHMECDKCPISSAYEQQKSAILDARKAERQRKQRKFEKQQKIEDLVKIAEDIYAKIRCPKDVEKASADLEKLADAFLVIKLK